MKKWLWSLALGFILLLGLSLRLINLTNVPHGFFCDEADITYNAYTLLHFGTDEFGKKFPLFFQSFGDYKDPLEIYSNIPFVAIFGLNEFASRFTSVMWGMIALLGIYFLTKEIRNSRIAALAAAGSGATMPWLIHYSRFGVEFSAYAATWSLSLYFFLKAFKKKIFFFPACIFLGITFYSYQPAKLLVPLLLVVLGITYHHMLWRHRRYVFMAFLVFLMIALPMIVSFFGVSGVARFAMVSVFSAHLTVGQTIARVLGNYFYQLSPAFFLTGEPTFITRHFTHGLLPLLQVTIPFLVIGLLYALITIRKTTSQLLLWLLILYPIAGAVVAEAPFTSRAVIGAPLFAVLIGIGMELVIRSARHLIGKITASIVIGALILFNLIIFVNFYFTQYPLYSSDFWGWQYGAGPVMNYFLEHQQEYDSLSLAGDFNGASIFPKFYDPEGTCEKCSIALPDDIFDPQKKQLFAMTPDEIAKRPQYTYTVIKSIYYPNGSEAFRLVTLQKTH